jgi:signal transduction histidine kinase
MKTAIPSIALRKPRILVVDDQPINIQTLYQIFTQDHEVFMATSGTHALEVVREQKPDLILLDVLMPGMDGHAVCQRLKDDPETRDIPVIFVTGQDNPEEETLGLELGAADFIRKPVNAAVVRARVHTQLVLRALKVHLEDQVAQRTIELESALLRLQESQEQLASSEAKATLSTLIASVSHELGSPIGNSVMMASTLGDQVRDFASLLESGNLKRSELSSFVAVQREGCDMVLSNLKRATDLLNDFRQVAADQASEQRREFDLATVIQEVISTLTPTLKRQPHRVVVEIPGGIQLDSQPGPLGQVAINLINNAFLHAFEGRTDGVLTIRAALMGHQVKIQFEDNGVGIPQDNLVKLFEPFFSTKIGKGGSGLGMAIVANLVQKTLKGHVSVRSHVGQGTCFDILLPLTLSEDQ